MEELFDEVAADKRIMRSLLKTNGDLWEELEHKRSVIKFLESQLKRSHINIMSRLVRDENGVLLVVHKAEELTAEAAHELLNHLRSEVAMLEQFLAGNVAPADNAPADQPAAPAEQPIAEQAAAPVEQPALVEQPAPAEQPAAPVVDQAAPADPTAPQPPSPAADPSAVPAPEQSAVPALDLSQAPAQPAPADPSVQQPLQ